MDIEKMIQQHPCVRKKPMNELIESKHKKNLKELDYLREKWLPKTVCSKETP